MPRRAPSIKAFPTSDSRDEKIRRLEDQLYDARKALLRLLPDETRTLLSGWRHNTSEKELDEWEHEIVEAITKLATPLPSTLLDGPRAMCPLCSGGSSWPYTKGYALPNGLKRHLFGDGNTRSCSVTKHAFALARYSLSSSHKIARDEEEH